MLPPTEKNETKNSNTYDIVVLSHTHKQILSFSLPLYFSLNICLSHIHNITMTLTHSHFPMSHPTSLYVMNTHTCSFSLTHPHLQLFHHLHSPTRITSQPLTHKCSHPHAHTLLLLNAQHSHTRTCAHKVFFT